MKPTRVIATLGVAGGLFATAAAQETPPATERVEINELPRLAPAESVAAEESGDPAGALPEIEYPEPTTDEQVKAASKHKDGAQDLAVEQDELSADVQELIEEQTDEKVIQLLEQVEEIMAEVIDALDSTETGGQTIAAETEIIEKIFEAAQQRAQQSGGT